MGYKTCPYCGLLIPDIGYPGHVQWCNWYRTDAKKFEDWLRQNLYRDIAKLSCVQDIEVEALKELDRSVIELVNILKLNNKTLQKYVAKDLGMLGDARTIPSLLIALEAGYYDWGADILSVGTFARVGLKNYANGMIDAAIDATSVTEALEEAILTIAVKTKVTEPFILVLKNEKKRFRDLLHEDARKRLQEFAKTPLKKVLGEGVCYFCQGSGICMTCHGNGTCPECEGIGQVTGWFGKKVCKRCKGNKSCPDCNGTKICSCCEGEKICRTCHGQGL